VERLAMVDAKILTNVAQSGAIAELHRSFAIAETCVLD
jgi:hypothetical protein